MPSVGVALPGRKGWLLVCFFFFSWDKMNLIFLQIFALRFITQCQARITYQLFLNQTLIRILLITFCTRHDFLPPFVCLLKIVCADTWFEILGQRSFAFPWRGTEHLKPRPWGCGIICLMKSGQMNQCPPLSPYLKHIYIRENVLISFAFHEVIYIPDFHCGYFIRDIN